MKDVRLLDRSFDPHAQIEPFVRAHHEAGGIATFVGQVRAGEGVEALELSHYPPLTLPGMEALADEALARFDIMGVIVLHRTGLLQPGEPIVMVSAAARHRRGALLAVDYVMDHLKSDAWFWKREKSAAGWRWIEPRAEDHADISRWKDKTPRN